MKEPELSVIVESQDMKNTTTFYEMIKERKLLKTKIKLMHINSFDHDLKTLFFRKLDLEAFGFPDFHITEEKCLLVPIKNRIISLTNNQKTLLKSYLIYLSYLYQINFFQILKQNPNYFYHLIFDLHIPEDIKQNLFFLLNGATAPYFSDNLELLNTHLYREQLEEDKKILTRILTKSVK